MTDETSIITPAQLQELTKSVEKIAREAGDILMDHFSTPLEIRFKGEFNMVTAADLASEQFILAELHRLTPGIPVLAEEEADARPDAMQTSEALLWMVDPLDGTTNFAHGLPHFCVSIALTHHHRPVLGVIFDPTRDEMFSATMHSPARLNGEIIHVSGTPALDRSLVVTGFSYKVRELRRNNLAEFCAFRLHAQGVRRIGAAALDLAYIAAGRMDGFWERWLKPWDTAAGILIVRRGGGTVTDLAGGEYSVFHPGILASNGIIHREMVHILTSPLPELPDFFVR